MIGEVIEVDWIASLEMKAHKNVKKWGLQDIPILLLHDFRINQISQAYLQYEHENGEEKRISEELDDLMALGWQLRWKLDGGVIVSPTTKKSHKSYSDKISEGSD